ncbi:hypothetical protein G7Z17_g1074 [Cylindrodendrum hubeiense]|uniref:Uncharacterized protein n=1 Tax=Cylindrodendrum hubeiense TaxID=595255 RepID=A0A9P5LMI9_9HYPO|nr:hypothetical protein G7Z17_g1074 [Cylindrodendrum hubeiense]
MNSSLQTVGRILRTSSTSRVQAQALSLGVNQARRLSTTDPDSSNRGGAVRDAIMDKLWVSRVFPPVATNSPVSPATSTPETTIFASRDPPLGTSVFDPSAAPRWSES